MPRIPDDHDPYQVLGILDPTTVTSAQIQKAYRQLALKLHPDKRRSTTTNDAAAAAAAAEERFHLVQEARAFLSDDEFAQARRAYDARRASLLQRQRAEETRRAQQSTRQQALQDKLRRQEARARQQQQQQQQNMTTAKRDTVLESLRREGKQRKQAYMEKQQQQQQQQQQQKQQQDESTLSDRQVRLKWNRKAIATSPSEDSLATELSQLFGRVVHVELLGSKGNQALVTFEQASSCRPCVDHDATSEIMRAKFVGDRKEREQAMEEAAAQAQVELAARTSRKKRSRDGETLEERRVRQAVEREALLREMMMTDQDEPKTATTTTKASTKSTPAHRTVPFPTLLPTGNTSSCLEELEKWETEILSSLLSTEQLQSMQVGRS